LIHDVFCWCGFHSWGDWYLYDLWSKSSGRMRRDCKNCGNPNRSNDHSLKSEMDDSKQIMFFDIPKCEIVYKYVEKDFPREM